MVTGSAPLAISRLSKRYPGTKTCALDSLSLEVRAGEVYGFLGANGAGKSTTIRTLLNFIQPTRGQAKICGLDIVKDSVEVKKHVGYLAGEVALYKKVTGRQFLDYMAALQPLKHRDYLKDLTERFSVDLDKPLETLSKGNRQKIGLLQAFMHEPEVLILDEPTSGLDPLMQEEFFKLISECKRRGATIFLSSHNLAEAQRVCDRVGIIKLGKLIHEQTIEASSSLTTPSFRVTLQNSTDISALKSAAHLKFVAQSDDHTLILRPSGEIAPALASLSRFKIKSLSSETMDLENEFLEFYGDKHA